MRQDMSHTGIRPTLAEYGKYPQLCRVAARQPPVNQGSKGLVRSKAALTTTNKPSKPL